MSEIKTAEEILDANCGSLPAWTENRKAAVLKSMEEYKSQPLPVDSIKPFDYDLMDKQIKEMFPQSLPISNVEDKWIIVENLPVKGKSVLLFNGHWIGVGFYDKNYELNLDDEPKWSDETGEYISPEPTHWQYLPKPPKRGKVEDKDFKIDK